MVVYTGCKIILFVYLFQENLKGWIIVKSLWYLLALLDIFKNTSYKIVFYKPKLIYERY